MAALTATSPQSKAQLIDEQVAHSRLQLVEGKDERTGRVFARGEFGHAARPTANKRLYKHEIWEANIERLRPSIESRKVLGELDHPCFLADDFRVLTVCGWKPFREISAGDRVWSRVNGEAVVSRVDGIVDQPYSGPAYTVKGRSICTGVTPGHRFLTLCRPDRGEGAEVYATVEEIVASPERYGHHAIPKTARWVSECVPTVRIPGVQGAGRCRNDVTQDLVLDSKLFSAFLGFYLAEGHCSGETVDNYGIFLSQTTEWIRKFIQTELLSRFPEELVWREEETGFFLSDARLYRYLQVLGDQYSRYIPEEVKHLDALCLTELLFWYTIGDGRMVATGSKKVGSDQTFKEQMAVQLREELLPNTRRDVFSVSESLIQDLHECLVRSGGAGSLSKIVSTKDYVFAGHTIKAENKVPLYQLHTAQSDHIWLDPRFLKIEKIHHSGKIYCLRTTHGNFYMEQEGKSFWTGNSDGRTALQRASHVITDLRLEGDQIVGEAEILDTAKGRDLKALLKAEIPVGISSRGYGSTQPGKDDLEVVQDDYKLMTFDFVAEPADEKAYPQAFFEGVEFPVELEGSVDSGVSVSPDVGQEAPASAAPALGIEELRKEFAATMLTRIHEMRAEVASQIRVELLADPTVAGAKIALGRIQEILRDHVLPEDVRVVVAEREAEIKQLRKVLSEAEARLEGQDTLITQLTEAAKEAGYKFYLAHLLAGDPDAERITQLVGDVTQYDSSQALAAKVESIRESVREQRLVEEKQQRNQLKHEARAQEKNRELAEGLERAMQMNKDLSLRLYAMERLQNHPQGAKIRTMLERTGIQSKEQVDDLIESLRAPIRDADELESMRSRVRARLGSGAEHLPEEAPARTRGRNQSYNGLGVPLAELKKLSGLRD